MTGGPEPVGTLDVALAHAEQLLASAPRLAAEQAREILGAVPDHPAATLLLGMAHRRSGRPGRSRSCGRSWPPSPAPVPRIANWGLRSVTPAMARKPWPCCARPSACSPTMADAWRALGDHLYAMGDTAGADPAYAQHIRNSTRDPRLLEPALALAEGRIAVAEPLLREHLKQPPTDVAAIRMLAEVAARLGRYGDAENLLARCLELAPGFKAARHNYAVVLHRNNKPARRWSRSTSCSRPSRATRASAT